MSSKTVGTIRTAAPRQTVTPFAVSSPPTPSLRANNSWWQLLDALAIAASAPVLFALLHKLTSAHTSALLDVAVLCYSALFAVVMVLTSKRLAYYATLRPDSMVDDLKVLLKATLFAEAVAMASLYLANSHTLTPSMLLVLGAASVAWMLSTRNLRNARVQQRIEAGLLTRNVLIVGYSDVGLALADHFRRYSRYGYVVKGFLDDAAIHADVLGTTADIENIIRSHFIDEIYIATQADRELVKTLSLKAPRYGVNVGIVPDMFDGIGWNAPIDRLGHFPVMVLHRAQTYALQRFLKRTFDILGAAIGIILTAPLMAIVAIAIKLDSAGPLFYIDTRVGRKGAPFRCLKFRTMCADADCRLHEVAHLNERMGGPLFKLTRDPRVTRVGRVLRRYSLDELPQLINVLFGEMSLVGPRPPTLREYAEYRLEHLRKLDVVPGITGLWQVSARRDPSFYTYIRYDLEYIENWSLSLDFEILLRTVVEIIRGTGT